MTFQSPYHRNKLTVLVKYSNIQFFGGSQKTDAMKLVQCSFSITWYPLQTRCRDSHFVTELCLSFSRIQDL